MLRKIMDIVLRYKVYITFAALVVISLSMISLGGSTRIGGFRTLIIGATGWVQDLFSWIPNPGALRSDNQSLRELNLQLSNDVIRMRRALLENKSLRQTLGFKQKIQDPFVIAEVTGKMTKFMKTYLTINKGRKQGVEEGMAVRTDAGLIGTVFGASDHYAFVDLITNPGTAIAGKVLTSHVDGVLVWENGNTFLMKYVPKNSGLEVGDEVITSGFSNKYPERIPIGKISKIEEDPGGINLRVYVESQVNFSTLEQVFVLKYLPDPELQKLIENMDKRLQARQNAEDR